MSGTFPGVSGVQQVDINGKPNIGAQLFVFIGGTNDLADTFQDIGLVLPARNPLVADIAGRIPLFFVADGTYKVRLVDQFGDVTNGGFEYPQVPSVGASSSGGGGSAVDPTTIAATGDIKAQLLTGTIAGWVRCNGRTIGNAVSGASERANADALALFAYLWINFSDALCPVPGGRGTSATNDWNAAKQITMPDARGRSIFGLDDMGNTPAGRLAGAVFSPGSNATLAGGQGGEGAHLTVQAELPNVTLATAIAAGQGSHLHTVPFISSNQNFGTNSGAYTQPAGSTNTSLATLPAMTGTTPLGGGDQPHNNMPPFVLGTIYMKL